MESRKKYLCEHIERNKSLFKKKLNNMLIALVSDRWEFVETKKTTGNGSMGEDSFILEHYFIHTDLKIKACVATDLSEYWILGAYVL